MDIRNILVKTAAVVMFTASGLIYAFMPAGDAGTEEFPLSGQTDISEVTGVTGAPERTVTGIDLKDKDTEAGKKDTDGNRDEGSETADGDGTGGDPDGDTRIDINSADAELLTTLPGIGPAKAEAILTYREEYGAFEKTEDLMNVPGIKNGIYSKIKDLICCR